MKRNGNMQLIEYQHQTIQQGYQGVAKLYLSQKVISTKDQISKSVASRSTASS